MNKVLGGIGISIGLILALVGCASISVQQGSQYATKQMPKTIYVEPFITSTGTFNVDREGQELATFKTGLQNMMTAGITEDVADKLGVTAVDARKFHPKLNENAWVIRGEFIQVNQGSRALRGIVGFGAGGTKMLTKVEVYDISGNDPKPFLTFSTTGGSNAEPGAISAIATTPLMIVIQAAASSAGGIGHGVSEDTARTARQVTATLSNYMYASGWIPKDKWIQPKAYDN